MAIVDNTELEPEPLPSEYRPRVVVKVRPTAVPPSTDARSMDPLASVAAEFADLKRRLPGVRLKPLFAASDVSQVRSLAGVPPPSGNAEALHSPEDLKQFLVMEPDSSTSAEEVVREVSVWPNVETAYIAGAPTPPPVNPDDDPRSSRQRFQDVAPLGIDARWMWELTDGSGVGFVDLEQGWTLNHEDLAGLNITIISGLNRYYPGHGTAVLGQVVAVDNKRGGIGIAPGASARVVSQWRDARTYDTASAIVSAAAVMAPGDVLLLEAQTHYPTVGAFVPVEAEPAVFTAIRAAVARGIVVVEAAGNGSVDLDAFTDVNGQQIFNRSNSQAFQDSGAIMVGAASATVPHRRLPFSNFGTRVDCFAWGEAIDTCGDGWRGNAPNAYTSGFGGTSGASPIIAGAALLLQSLRVKQGMGPCTPLEMRRILADASINTASANPGTDRIGVMPRLRAIVTERRMRSAGSLLSGIVS